MKSINKALEREGNQKTQFANNNKYFKNLSLTAGLIGSMFLLGSCKENKKPNSVEIMSKTGDTVYHYTGFNFVKKLDGCNKIIINLNSVSIGADENFDSGLIVVDSDGNKYLTGSDEVCSFEYQIDGEIEKSPKRISKR